jgi:hypothetical protein
MKYTLFLSKGDKGYRHQGVSTKDLIGCIARDMFVKNQINH